MRKDDKPVLVEETGVGRFQSRVRTRNTAFFADEPVEVGGLGSGLDPFELAGAALAACTVMTMRLYAQRKGWRMARLSAKVRHSRPSATSRDRFDLLIQLDPKLSADQQARLLEIASKCPVHRLLAPGADIVTEVGHSDLSPPSSASTPRRSEKELRSSDEAALKAA
jgi:putative redox protein